MIGDPLRPGLRRILPTSRLPFRSTLTDLPNNPTKEVSRRMPSDIITNQPRNRANSNAQPGHQRRPAARHEATCANCGVATTVPFKPTAERPVYCSACFADRKQSPVSAREPQRRDDVDRERSRERPEEAPEPIRTAERKGMQKAKI